MRMLTRSRGQLLLVVGSVAVGLLLCEIALRVFKPQLMQWDTGAIWEPAVGLGWRRRPNLDVRVNTGEREVRFLTDAARHRVGITQEGPGQIRILAVGDSMLEAVQVDYEQSMPALLARALSTTLGRHVEVVNTGVGGWNPNQYLSATQQELQQSSYDLLLIFLYVDNDIVSQRAASYPPAISLTEPVLRPLEDGPARTLGILGVRFQALLAEYSHLFVFSRNLAQLPRARSGIRAHLLSNAMRSNRAMPAWRITGDILGDIAVAAAGAHVPVLYILLPSVQYVDQEWLTTLERALGLAPADVDLAQPAELLGVRLKRRGLELFDPTPALKQAFDAGERDLYGRIDPHFAPAGHQVMARFLEPIVLSHLPAAEVTR